MFVTLKPNDYSFSKKTEGKRVIAHKRFGDAVEVRACELQRVGVERSQLPVSLTNTYIFNQNEYTSK